MKIIITGGGSGGHFYPLMAVADKVREVNDDKHIIQPKIYYMADVPYDENVLFRQEIEFIKTYSGKLRRGAGIKGFFSSSVRGLAKVLRKDRPDVVILTGWQIFPLLQALFCAVMLRIPRIVRAESNGMKPRGWRVRLVHRLLLPLYNGYLVIGRANQQFYSGYGVPRQKLFSCPYFVDNERFLDQVEKSIRKRDELRSRWSIPAGSICFLYVGKLTEKKRILDQLSALKSAMASDSNIHLLVVGTGELLEDARKEVKKNHLPVSFVGFLNQTEITDAYGVADCLILSSDYDETWGLVVNEAMVCGLPAIVSDRVGCGPDLVEEGITGSLYPFGDIQTLAARMLYMAENQERLLQMGKNAQRRVLQHYNVKKAVKGTLAAVEDVTGQAIS
ncbi:MAG: hypothetical protein DSY70_01480 [Desulfobulbus sp.]|nr:MAG: hypothetical protein DSY70_01480 [Desulfobulbus sp.]